MQQSQDDLSLQWAQLGNEGLVRTVKVVDFEAASALVQAIASVVARVGLEPNVQIEHGKVTVSIEQDTDGLYTKLARELDFVL